MPEIDPSHIVHCIKLKKDLPGLKTPPFQNDLGRLIYDNVSKEAWDLWLKESVRYVNTSGVELGTRKGNEYMLNLLKVWFGFEAGEMPQTNWTPPKEGA